MATETRQPRMAATTPAGPDAAADAAVSAWKAVAAALSPIIGQGGVAALYRRSLQLASAKRPWLTTGPDEAGGDDFAALRTALSRRSGSEAEAGHAALMAIFNGLLTSLIGASLAERLLAPSTAAGDTDDDSPTEPRP